MSFRELLAKGILVTPVWPEARTRLPRGALPMTARLIGVSIVLASFAIQALMGCKKESGAGQPQTHSQFSTPGNAGTIHSVTKDQQAGADCPPKISDGLALGCRAQFDAIDREADRLHQLAKTGKFMTRERPVELEAGEKRWHEDLHTCDYNYVNEIDCLSEFAEHVHALRRDYADARSADAQGISRGPVPVTCDGIDAGIGATFIDTNPGFVVLEWSGQSYTLIQTANDRGGGYSGEPLGNHYAFWVGGDDARLQVPGAKPVNCVLAK